MLRDMEELLNSVHNQETKDYLREALNYYNAGSYKACVIMSVIAGSHDLHNKLKVLASNEEKYSKLEKEVDNKKKKLKPYEKYLIEKCACQDIDLLTPNEEKELIRCLDTRNDCAHPSDFFVLQKKQEMFTLQLLI